MALSILKNMENDNEILSANIDAASNYITKAGEKIQYLENEVSRRELEEVVITQKLVLGSERGIRSIPEQFGKEAYHNGTGKNLGIFLKKERDKFNENPDMKKKAAEAGGVTVGEVESIMAE
ncbi:hypothetical protein BJ508DRAFT_315925 [Ascobolus immersus RN42]|uniref:Uncharacterized protein n=1 Tax=Ascobolus immersus RN42 TaxID=1160509 RepID=A0A3N4HDI4_ASCIM|nr:hypothetical protein BJ508DRAFT_315925 [Ascobolus immersus RN42]